MKLTISLCLILCLVNLLRVASEPPAECAILKNVIRQCDCEGARDDPNKIVINCRLKQLKSMPSITGTYSGTIHEFTLAINEIEVIPANAFGDLKIERLDITQNKITTVSDSAFQGLSGSLKVLKLDGALSSSVSPPFTAISSLTNLEELTLRHFSVPNNNLEQKSYFQPFSKLRLLTLDTWGLKLIGTDVFLGLTGLVKLHLSNHLNLVSLPVEAINSLKETLQEIEITHTGITALTFYMFQQLQALKTLKLKSNKIRTLEDECFSGLEIRLEHLDLSFNRVEQQLSQVRVLRGLKTLLLQNTGLSLNQNSPYLKNKPNLQTLNLASNNLLTVRDNAFSHVTSLTSLDLSDNHISTMEDNALQGLTSLEELFLNNQELARKQLTLPSLATLTSLTSLSLTKTSLSGGSWNKIKEAKALQTLNMRQTLQQGSIPDFTFKNLKNLVTLDLASNGIMSINQKSLHGPSSTLRNIHLDSNSIKHFDSCTFHNYNFPIELDLSLNPLDCDCTLYWLRKAYKDGNIKLMTYEECSYPPNLDGTRFTQNSLSDFCLSPPSLSNCEEFLFPTDNPVTSTSSVQPSADISVNILTSTATSITVSWVIVPLDVIQHITILHSKLQSTESPIRSRQLDKSNTQYTIPVLAPDTSYQICVEAEIVTGGNVQHCVKHRTESSSTIISTTPSGSEASSQTGIIVGAVIGGLVFFAILAVIIYILVFRRKPRKNEYPPIESHVISPVGMPKPGEDSKRYRKKDGNTDKNKMNVTVISDGQTSPPKNGRLSTGSYQYLQNNVKDKPNPQQLYINNEENRQNYQNESLQKMPKAYEAPNNAGNSDDQALHTYSEITV